MRYARYLPVRGSASKGEASRAEGAEDSGSAFLVRPRLLRTVVCAALAAGLLLSPDLWLTRDALFPMTPPWEPLRVLAPARPWDSVLFGALLVSLLPAALLPRGWHWFAGVALVLCVFLALADQQRWQPWFYQDVFMLGALVFCREGSALNACRLIVAATYFWSGLQKANFSFRENVYPWLVEPFAGFVSDAYGSWLSMGAYAVPVVEAAIGLGLLAKRTRPFAVVGALLMHAFIMASIGPWGHDWNTAVWPWNAAMVAFVLVLFWRPPDAPSPLSILRPGRSAFRWAVAVLFAFMPLLSFWSWWDSYLSASLYSGNTKEGFMVTRGPQGTEPKRTDLFDVSLDRLNVPIYPEEEVFENAARARCSEAKRPGRTRLVLLDKPDILSGEREREVIRCRELLEGSPGAASTG